MVKCKEYKSSWPIDDWLEVKNKITFDNKKNLRYKTIDKIIYTLQTLNQTEHIYG